MKQVVLFIICLFFVTISLGQQAYKRNDIYLEAGGNGLFASVNYERQLTKEPGIGIRIGAGFYTEDAFYLTIPVGINYLFKLKRVDSFIDAGLGVTWARVDANLFKQAKNSTATHFVSFVPSIGYRRHAKQNMMWRVSITPVANSETFVPWVGFSVGKRF